MNIGARGTMATAPGGCQQKGDARGIALSSQGLSTSARGRVLQYVASFFLQCLSLDGVKRMGVVRCAIVLT